VREAFAEDESEMAVQARSDAGDDRRRSGTDRQDASADRRSSADDRQHRRDATKRPQT
jgi:hypothetical protein